MKLELKLTNDWLEATWIEDDKQVHCESFSGHTEHIAMLRAKALEYDTKLDEALIKECIANFKMPTAEELLIEANKVKLQEALAYLVKTNHKCFIGYIPKDGEDLVAIQALRDEALLFIRANDVHNP